MKKLLVILMILSITVTLIACGGEVETQAPETDLPETEPVGTNAPETDPTETDPIGETEHVHDLLIEDKVATCSERGYHIETCKTCGEVVAETAYPKLSCVANGDATCDTDSVCTMCGSVLEAAFGHSFSDLQVVEASCTAPGSKSGTCTTCGETVSEEIPVTHDYDMNTFTIADDGTIKASCKNCGEVTVSEEIRVVLNFEKEVEAELSESAYGANLRLVDSKVSSVYKKANAFITTNEDRTVLAPKGAISIDFDPELLSDARYYMVSFDYYLSTDPTPEDPANPTRATVFAFVPGFQNGAKASTIAQQWGNFTKFTYGKGWVYSQFGSISDINGGAKVYQPKAGEWYRLAYIVDNVNGVAYAYVNGAFVASPTVPAGVFSVTAETAEKYEGYFTMLFGDAEIGKYGAQFDNFEISVIR